MDRIRRRFSITSTTAPSEASSSAVQRLEPERIDEFRLVYRGRHRAVETAVFLRGLEHKSARESFTQINQSKIAKAAFLLTLLNNMSAVTDQVRNELAVSLLSLQDEGLLMAEGFPTPLRDHIREQNWYQGHFSREDGELLMGPDLFNLIIQLMGASLFATE